MRVKSPPARAALWVETWGRQHSAHLPVRHRVHSPVETKHRHTQLGISGYSQCCHRPHMWLRLFCLFHVLWLQEWDFGGILKPRTTDFQDCFRDEIGREGREGEREQGAGDEMQSQIYILRFFLQPAESLVCLVCKERYKIIKKQKLNQREKVTKGLNNFRINYGIRGLYLSEAYLHH